MTSPITHRLDELASWRSEVSRRVSLLGRALADHEVLDDAGAALLAALRERLASDKLVLAFVAEFSRGKTELINAIFFADAGVRMLPATPGRTTMCPVELRWDPDSPPQLSLLPIETRLRGLSLAELRPRAEHWHTVPLQPDDAQALVQAFSAVTRVQRVPVENARALGLWDDSQPQDNPPRGADGNVEVPAWRHAVINYPHPLLQRGMVVVDTPGLNAIGAEPELTLSLLPTAHAAVFVLSADAGVTRSDLTIWLEHLGGASLDRYVVLNKIDTLRDPLLSAAAVDEQIEQQRRDAASLLGIDGDRVFALSARDALAARLAGDDAALAASRLLPLEAALAAGLLPRHREVLAQSTLAVVERLRVQTARRLAERRRQQAEQLFELRGLRGKSGAKTRMLVERVEAESADFERCTSRLAALRAVQLRIQRELLTALSSETLRVEVGAMHAAMLAKPLRLGARAAFETLLARLRAAIARATTQAEEMRQMLDASFRALNTEFGFTFAVGAPPSFAECVEDLASIEKNYGRYLGLSQIWRMAAPGFAEQFRRLLLSKLRVGFENAAGEVEMWSKAALTQVDVQLRERRRAFARRREALQRVQGAAGELEARITEVQAQDDRLAEVQARIDALVADAVAATNDAAPTPPLAQQAAA